MRKLDLSNVIASSDEGFAKLPAGPYVVQVTSAKDVPEREYVEFAYDVAEGANKGFYSDEWSKSNTYSHRICMSYKDTALGMLKGRLERFSESNQGFDAVSAFENEQIVWFVGRVVGVNLQEEEYVGKDKDGRPKKKTRLSVAAVVSAQDVRDGKVKPLPKKELSEEDKRMIEQAQPQTYDDVPF